MKICSLSIVDTEILLYFSSYLTGVAFSAAGLTTTMSVDFEDDDDVFEEQPLRLNAGGRNSEGVVAFGTFLLIPSEDSTEIEFNGGL